MIRRTKLTNFILESCITNKYEFLGDSIYLISSNGGKWIICVIQVSVFFFLLFKHVYSLTLTLQCRY